MVGSLKKYYLLLFCSVFVLFAEAQYHDFGMWGGVSGSKKIAKKTALSVASQVRLEENYTRVGSGLVDFQLGYKLNKKITIAGAYRFSQKNDYRIGWATRHRVQIRLALKKKINPITIQYRTLLQIGVKKIYQIENWYSPSKYWRNKLQLKLDLDKKFEPYLGVEMYYNIVYNLGFDRYRIVAGVSWDLPNKMALKTGYLMQKQFNKQNPVTDYILVIAYSIKF